MGVPRRPNPECYSVQQRAAMAHRFIKKHDVAMVTLHWFNALVWLLELLTGAGLIVSEKYSFAPIWFAEIMLGIFGSRANMLHFHIAIGVLWATMLLIYGIFGFRTYLLGFYRNDLVMDRDDLLWLRRKTMQILGRQVALPEQGVYNAGQKGYAWIISFGTLVVIFTGFVMSFHLGPQWLVQWSIPLHFLAVGVIVAGLVIHIYMAAILPEERPAFFSMLHGKVSELYAYEYHTKWWRQRKEAERKFHDELGKE
jgi:formate dehydrogenase subunit gamma